MRRIFRTPLNIIFTHNIDDTFFAMLLSRSDSIFRLELFFCFCLSSQIWLENIFHYLFHSITIIGQRCFYWPRLKYKQKSALWKQIDWPEQRGFTKTANDDIVAAAVVLFLIREWMFGSCMPRALKPLHIMKQGVHFTAVMLAVFHIELQNLIGKKCV